MPPLGATPSSSNSSLLKMNERILNRAGNFPTPAGFKPSSPGAKASVLPLDNSDYQ